MCACRLLKPELFNELIQPKIDNHVANNPILNAVTLFGLQVKNQADLASNQKRHIFVYGNCAFDTLDGYASMMSLKDAGYLCDRNILSQVNTSKFLIAGSPELNLVYNRQSRMDMLKLYLTLTIQFHNQNAAAVLWGQGTMWASLLYMNWLALDKAFPILYLVSNEAGAGKTTAFNAYARSIGLPLESIGGNKTSESGFLDWVSTYSCLSFFIDDFNPRKCINRTNDTWLDLFKQLYDAKTVVQHDKIRLVYSSTVVSANAEMPPDVPTQTRLISLHFILNKKHPRDISAIEDHYNQVFHMISCLVPDIISMKFNGDLDKTHINELQQFIMACSPSTLTPRVAQNLKKPLYYLLLVFKWVEMDLVMQIQEGNCSHDQLADWGDLVDIYIFDYMCVLIKQYALSCSQVDLWSRFFYCLDKALSLHDKHSRDVSGSLNW